VTGQDIAGGTLPGTTLHVSLGRFTGVIQGISVSDRGSVAFGATYFGGLCPAENVSCSGIFQYDKQTTKILAFQHGAAPNSAGGTFGMDLKYPSVNGKNVVAFEGSYSDGNCKLSGSCGGVYMTSGEELLPIAVWNQPVVGLSSGRYYNVEAPWINESGNLAVRAMYSEGFCPDPEQFCFAILAIGMKPSTVALEGEEAPGTGGEKYVGGEGSFGFGRPTLNNRNMVGYVAELVGGACKNETCEGLFLFAGAEAKVVAMTGRRAPGTAGGTFQRFSKDISLNDAGDLAFQATYVGGSCPFKPRCNGVFVAKKSGVIDVALANQPAPGRGNSHFYSFGVPSINDIGIIGFSAILVNQSTNPNEFAIFLASPFSARHVPVSH